MSQLDAIEIEPIDDAEASIIWMHGLGADGSDFEPLVPQLGVDGKAIRFIFPHAPVQPITINGGIPMRAWYDILGLELTSREDDNGIRESAALVDDLINREVERGIPQHKILLAGFSQGGAMALHVGLRVKQRIAGILALSTYLPLAKTVEAEHSVANKNVPIFMAHGTQDPVVPLLFGNYSHDHLQALGYNVDWNTYPMQHNVCPEEVKDIKRWLGKVF